jgi:C-terminal processing protease CtpA/Prc
VDGDEFISRIKGPDGTLVRLTVRRGAQTFDVNIARRRLSW